MGLVMPMEWRKLLAAGTGVGIEIGETGLRVAVVRVRPGGVALLGHTVIAGFRERPAAGWGAEYARFMSRLGAGHLAAVVLLPRRDVIVREILLPGVSGRDLASAVGFRTASLHPYAEEDAVSAWVRLAGDSVLVAIARRALVERYASLFQEAGIKIASFTFSASALHAAVRLLKTPPEGGFFTMVEHGGELEFYGESAARPVLSAVIEGPRERSASLASAELRLPPGTAPAPVESLLPAPKGAPADYDLSREALPYAAALAGACPRLAPAANLLPDNFRSAASRAMYVPAAALAAVLILLLIGLAARAGYQDRRYLAALKAEIARLEPAAREVDRAERSISEHRAQLRLLDDFRLRTKADLDALNELTRLLKPPGWLSSLDLTREGVTLAGEAEQAAQLLSVLDGSPFFRDSEFTVPISRSGQRELFRLRATREGASR